MNYAAELLVARQLRSVSTLPTNTLADCQLDIFDLGHQGPQANVITTGIRDRRVPKAAKVARRDRRSRQTLVIPQRERPQVVGAVLACLNGLRSQCTDAV